MQWRDTGWYAVHERLAICLRDNDAGWRQEGTALAPQRASLHLHVHACTDRRVEDSVVCVLEFEFGRAF